MHLLRGVMALALLGVIAAMLFAWLMPQDFSESRSAYLRLASAAFFLRVFQLHIGLLVLVLLLVALVTRSLRLSAIAGATSFVLLLPYGREYLPKTAPTPTSTSVRVMSMNLFVNNRDADSIIRSIEETNPDIVIIAEATQWFRTEIYTQRLKARYPTYKSGWYSGGADVMTRLPATPPAHDPLYRHSPFVFQVGGQEVALFPVHLVSPGHVWLVGYNRVQIAEFESSIRQEIDENQRPVIIAGDFNFTPLTPNFYRLRSYGLRTTHELAGYGLGNTWGPKWWPWLNRLPGVRIDHIFLSPPLTATSHRVGQYSGSDHLPIVADVALSKPQ